MTALPYENASSGDKAYAEMQKVLDKFDCDNFGMMTSNANGTTLIRFTHKDQPICIEASWNGYAQAWLKENPWSNRRNATRDQWTMKALQKGKMAVPSMIRDWVKAQIIMVEIGAFDFEEAFMPHIQLADGRRVIEHARENGLLKLTDASAEGSQ